MRPSAVCRLRAVVLNERASREASELGSLLIRREEFIVGDPGHIDPLYVSHESWRGRGPELISFVELP